jgi:hypothetical protein
VRVGVDGGLQVVVLDAAAGALLGAAFAWPSLAWRPRRFTAA